MAYLKSGNTTYELKLGFNGLSEFEAITGKSLMGKEEIEFSFQEIRIILHLAIRGGDRKYRASLEETGELLDEIADERGFDYLAEMIEKVMEESLGKQTQTGNQKAAHFQGKK